MNKKVILSVFVILVVIAASLGATMAWFTDQATVEPNVFQAGTVLIDADEDFPEGGADRTLENWNPGDCDEKEVTIEVIGSKRVYIKADIEENWTDLKALDGDGYVMYDGSGNAELADPSTSTYYGPVEADNPVNWKVEKDGELVDFIAAGEWTRIGNSWYFVGILDPGGSTTSTTIISQVCLDGEDADNKYQRATYTLEFDFSAIQVTHEAVFEMWGVGYLAYDQDGLVIEGWYPVVTDANGDYVMDAVPDPVTAGTLHNFKWTPTGSGIANHTGWVKQ